MNIVPGTAIATFDDKQRYGNQVLDQWMNHSVDRNGTRIAIPHPVSQRTIFFRNAPRAANNGKNYYVLE